MIKTKIKKIIFVLSIFSSTLILINRFGADSNFAQSSNLVWYVKPCLSIPIEPKMESHFTNLYALYFASQDPEIKSLDIVVQNHDWTIPIMQEVFVIVNSFKKNNKSVTIWACGLDTKIFPVFANCSRRILSNDSSLILHGFSILNYFQKNRLEKKKINVWGVQAGDFKGGLASDLSNEFGYYDATNALAFIQDMSAQIKEYIAFAMSVNLHKVENWFNFAYFSSQDILKEGFADEFGMYRPKTNEMTLEKYSRKIRHYMGYSKNNVPVILIDPVITYPRSVVFANKLNNIANDQSIKTVVLYIKSFGGSTAGCSLVYDSIMNLKSNGKYVIALVDCAYSAAYHIASGADKIFARSGSGIGSIGVYCKFTEMDERLKKKGVNVDGVYTHEPDLMKFPILTDKQKDFVVNSVKVMHKQFIDIVMQNRKIDVNLIEDIAQGQIFTGAAAKKLGLIDSLRGFEGMLELLFALYKGDHFSFCFMPDIKMWQELEMAGSLSL